MRTILNWIAVITIFSLEKASASNANPPPPDHLLPIDQKLSPPLYRQILRQRLCVTPADAGRALILPAFSGEQSLSVYSRQSAGGHRQYVLTVLTAEESLSDATSSGRHVEEATKVKVDRVDAEIPERTGELIKRTWSNMLLRTHHIQKNERALEFSFADAAVVELTLPVSASKVLSGWTVMAQGRLPQKVNELVIITDLLMNYSKALPTARPAIAKKIDDHAIRLVKMLSTPKKE